MEIKVGDLISVVGRRGSGKSTLLKYISSILLKTKQYDFLRVCCPTAHLNNDYKHIEDKHIITNNIEEYLINLYDEQKKAITNGNYKAGLLVLDDIAGSINFRSREKLFNTIASTGRHYKITTVFIVQYVKTCPPIIRTQSSHIILMGRFSDTALNSIFEQYNPTKIQDFKRFKEILNNSDFTAIIIDNGNGNLYKIKAPENFKVPKITQGEK